MEIVTVTVTREELNLLQEALDSHQYWQLADERYRRDGFVVGRGSDDPAAREALQACDALVEKLTTATACDVVDLTATADGVYA